MYLYLSRDEDTIEFWDEEIERSNLNLIIQKQMGLICKTLFPGNPSTAQIVSLRDWELLNMPHFSQNALQAFTLTQHEKPESSEHLFLSS